MAQLNENSLYTDAASRAALLADKKRVMDALVFSLLGFLGCFRMGDRRSVLKTYDQSEGKLQLQSIGDANHDVSLSVKLAEEAGCIPTAAAQNVTKLLYKIKSRAVKGSDLDDNHLRALIKTLKIQSHPLDTIVLNAVNEYESGHSNIAQLCKKLYALSKLPKFKDVSGEFRNLVMKGSYTDIMNTLAAPNTSAAPVSTSSASTSSGVAPTLVKDTQPSDVAVVDTSKIDAEIEMLFLDNFKKRAYDFLQMLDNTTIRYKISMNDLLVKLANWVKKQVVDEKVVLTEETTRTLERIVRSFETAAIMDSLRIIHRCNLVGTWRRIEPGFKRLDFDSGSWFELFSPNFKNVLSTSSNIRVDVWNREMFEFLLSDQIAVEVINKRGFADLFEFSTALIKSIFLLAGNSIQDLDSRCEVPYVGPSLLGWLLQNCHTLSFGTEYVSPNPAEALDKIFNVDKKHRTVKRTTDGNGFDIPVNAKDIGADKEKIVEGMCKLRHDYFVFINPDAWEEDLKRNIVKLLADKKYSVDSISKELLRASSVAPNGYEKSERFLNWFISKITDNIATPFFSQELKSLTTPQLDFFFNLAINYMDAKKPSPKVWASVYTAAIETQKSRYIYEIQAIYEDNYQILETSLVNLFGTMKMKFEDSLKLVSFFLEMNKQGKFKAPNDKDFWKLVASATTEDLKEWDIPKQMQEYLWGLSQNVNQLKIREELISNFEHTREWFYGEELAKMKKMDPSIAIENIVANGWTKIVPKEQIPKDMIEFVEDNVKHIDPHKINLFSQFGTGYGEWLKELITNEAKEKLLSFDDSSFTANSFLNALHISIQTLEHLVDKSRIDVINSAFKGKPEPLINIFSALEKNPRGVNAKLISKLCIPVGQETGPPQNVCVSSLCDILMTMIEGENRSSDADAIFSSLSHSVTLKKKVVEWFRKSRSLHNAMKSLKGEVIAPLIDLDHKSLSSYLKYNNLDFESNIDDLNIDTTTKLSDYLKSSKVLKLAPLAVKTDIEDVPSCDRRTAEFDVFNKYRHGKIGIKFIKSFDVDIPIQKELTEKWNLSHKLSEVMDPVFHGCGSVAASFILRYGFAVKALDASMGMVGRMLGDGIYFSNVLDKCGQYVSDGGYSRGIGNRGYLLQMRANLGDRGPDYQVGGGHLVSPEWCVFHPNEQLKIYKAHFIELVSRNDVDAIKSKVLKMNESTAIRIHEMREHLNEELQNPPDTGCVSYTFIDGTIPISEFETVPYESWDPTSVGPHITVEPSGLGPVMYIRVEDPRVCDIFAVRYTTQFMNQGEDFMKFLQLLRGGSTSST